MLKLIVLISTEKYFGNLTEYGCFIMYFQLLILISNNNLTFRMATRFRQNFFDCQQIIYTLYVVL